MGVAAELEVDVGLLGQFEVVGLVVEQDGEDFLRRGSWRRCGGEGGVGSELGMGLCRQFLDRLAVEVGAVVAPDDDEGAVYHGRGVAEEVDAGLAEKPLGFGTAAVVFMVAQTGIDGCVEAVELGGHVFFDEGADAAVDDVAGNEDEVGLFGIDHIDPSGEFGAGVVVAEVEVAQHDDSVVLGEGFGGGKCEGHTHFVLVVEVAVEEDGENGHKDACHRPPIAVEPRTGNEMDEPSEVEQEEGEDEIEHDEDGGGAYLVEHLRQRKGERVKIFVHDEEKQPEAACATEDDEALPSPMEWQQCPDVPADVCDAHQWQEKE